MRLDRDAAAGTNGEGDALQYFAFIGVIGKIDIVKLQRAPAWYRQGSGRFAHLGSYIDHPEQSLSRS